MKPSTVNITTPPSTQARPTESSPAPHALRPRRASTRQEPDEDETHPIATATVAARGVE